MIRTMLYHDNVPHVPYDSVPHVPCVLTYIVPYAVYIHHTCRTRFCIHETMFCIHLVYTKPGFVYTKYGTGTVRGTVRGGYGT